MYENYVCTFFTLLTANVNVTIGFIFEIEEKKPTTTYDNDVDGKKKVVFTLRLYRRDIGS